MTLPPAYDGLRKHGIRFVENRDKWTDGCHKCGGINLHVQVESDGAVARWHCDDCGWNGCEPPSAQTGGSRTSRDDDDEAKRKDFPEDDDALDHIEAQIDEREQNKLTAYDPDGSFEIEPASEAPTSDAAEGAGDGSFSHIWRSKDYDYPCTPTGEEQRDDAGRIYARVNTLDGSQSFVPKDEIVPKGEPEPEPEDEEEPEAKPTPLPDKGLDFADFVREQAQAEAEGRKSRLRVVQHVFDLGTILEVRLKDQDNLHGPFSDELRAQFARLKREQPDVFALPGGLDAATVRAALERASKDAAVDLFIVLALVIDLNPVEIDALTRLAAKKAGVGLRPLASMLNLRQTEQAVRRKQALKAKRRAERTDPRPMVPEPAYNDPFVPVMNKINTVMDVVTVSERPPRDIDGVSTRLRKLSVPKMHAFDQTQANAGDDDDD